MYLTYEEYADMGGGVDAAAFARLEAKARQKIDSASHNRLKGELEVREAVKRCAFELIEEIRREEACREMASGREIAAMDNDGLSLRFVQQSASNGFAAHRAQILRDWLGAERSSDGVRLLYAGTDG